MKAKIISVMHNKRNCQRDIRDIKKGHANEQRTSCHAIVGQQVRADDANCVQGILANECTPIDQLHRLHHSAWKRAMHIWISISTTKRDLEIVSNAYDNVHVNYWEPRALVVTCAWSSPICNAGSWQDNLLCRRCLLTIPQTLKRRITSSAMTVPQLFGHTLPSGGPRFLLPAGSIADNTADPH